MNHYPTDEELDTIEKWKFTKDHDFKQFMDYVKSVGNYWKTEAFGWRQRGRTYHVSTGGWSGNESILAAMRGNWLFWSVCWYQSNRGGRYVFKTPDPKAYWGPGSILR